MTNQSYGSVHMIVKTRKTVTVLTGSHIVGSMSPLQYITAISYSELRTTIYSILLQNYMQQTSTNHCIRRSFFVFFRV